VSGDKPGNEEVLYGADSYLRIPTEAPNWRIEGRNGNRGRVGGRKCRHRQYAIGFPRSFTWLLFTLKIPVGTPLRNRVCQFLFVPKTR